MPTEVVHFYKQNTKINLRPVASYRKWLNKVASAEKHKICNLSYIFCDDEFLLTLNEGYLQHDTLTDVITFEYSSKRFQIEGEIYISIERIEENAAALGISTEIELRRVMAHGLLHLCGYGDKSKKEKEEMTMKEDSALLLW